MRRKLKYSEMRVTFGIQIFIHLDRVSSLCWLILSRTSDGRDDSESLNLVLCPVVSEKNQSIKVRFLMDSVPACWASSLFGLKTREQAARVQRKQNLQKFWRTFNQDYFTFLRRIGAVWMGFQRFRPKFDPTSSLFLLNWFSLDFVAFSFCFQSRTPITEPVNVMDSVGFNVPSFTVWTENKKASSQSPKKPGKCFFLWLVPSWRRTKTWRWGAAVWRQLNLADEDVFRFEELGVTTGTHSGAVSPGDHVGAECYHVCLPKRLKAGGGG